MHANQTAGVFAQKQNTCQAISMDFYVPGGPRAPLYIFLHGPAHKGCFQWSSIKGLLWALCDVPFLCCLLISISKPSGISRGTPSPHIFFGIPAGSLAGFPWALVTSIPFIPYYPRPCPGPGLKRAYSWQGVISRGPNRAL